MSTPDSEVYLGDGLYASFDGHMFKLRAPRYEGDHWVALEPAVMYAFDQYRAAVMEKIAKQQIEGELDKLKPEI